MKDYWKLALFLALWAGFFVEHWHAGSVAYFIFICAVSILLYYLMYPTKNNQGFQYAHLVLLTVLYIIMPSHYLLLLMLLVHLSATRYLSLRPFLVQTIVFGATASVLQILYSPLSVSWLILVIWLLYSVYQYKAMAYNYEEKNRLYDGLLEEYRKIKRSSFQTEKMVRLEERTKIAREIHDSVGHKLTSLIMMLKIKEMKGQVAMPELVQLADEALQETRQAVRALTSEEVQGIHSVLHLVRKLEAESHISISFSTEKGILSAQLSNEQNSALYRMLQEGLTNAMKYGDSREVQVKLSKTANGDVEFVVTNKSTEYKPIQYGFGLRGMKERIKELGGRLHVYQEGGQFIVRGIFPVHRSE
ncbi:sensor histidine kinase [Bacillus sp. 1P06AnD]|uniref:sensor histidine kinase n=1 Tax=Bacillus sp. 1P06AnD TaxID=3132208 RepID=UPI0039A3C9DB